MTKPRPTETTEDMKREVARDICAALVEDGHFSQNDAEARAGDLVSAITHRADGYQLARKLDDDFGWSISLSVIEALEGCRYQLDEEILHAQRDWVKEEGIQPVFVSGQPVVLRSGETGVIDCVSKHRPACYEVKIDGDEKADGPMKSRRLCRFEDVEVAPTLTL